jgi:hypothetical protein
LEVGKGIDIARRDVVRCKKAAIRRDGFRRIMEQRQQRRLAALMAVPGESFLQ